ncbi:hypothetical protein [Paraburkholderia aromaticivorans]|uniref:hypothetical protein n=1 Tax=Paraburkholderia aromaticivorans TaxID=2026199 RepID=UPI0014561EDB|nr:hypothetical protein [Paraburkholderia aromaticivorans]
MLSTFTKNALAKFSGCDSDEFAAGTLSNPSIWLFGIEHGTYKSIHDESFESNDDEGDDSYSITMQRRWPYNVKAFKLLAAIRGFQVADWLDFAERHQPFVKGSPGYFKGNIYPYACHDVEKWPERFIQETGITNKLQYQAWCRNHRFPVIRNWIREHSPSIFIGLGIGFHRDFAAAVFGTQDGMEEAQISTEHYRRRIFHKSSDGKRLVVIPHFSGANGLNSNALIQKTGEFIAEFMLK